jgi:hypothetical protein
MTRSIWFPVALLLASGLVGCGGGGKAGAGPIGTDGGGGATDAGAEAGTSVAQTLAAMQAGGELPTLDVGTTLMGDDVDGNGVRDDVDRFIAAQGDSPVEKASLTQLARAVQATLTTQLGDEPSLSKASTSVMRGVACVWSAYGRTQASNKVATIEQITVNTQQRFAAYATYNAALDGQVMTLPSGSVCDV